jgi:hypothetical protein
MGVKSTASISMLAAMQRMELYYSAHPGSPFAVRRPELSMRGKMWTALLGPNLRDGIAGFGPTVEAALKDFDVRYLRALRSPEITAIKNSL